MLEHIQYSTICMDCLYKGSWGTKKTSPSLHAKNSAEALVRSDGENAKLSICQAESSRHIWFLFSFFLEEATVWSWINISFFFFFPWVDKHLIHPSTSMFSFRAPGAPHCSALITSPVCASACLTVLIASWVLFACVWWTAQRLSETIKP